MKSSKFFFPLLAGLILFSLSNLSFTKINPSKFQILIETTKDGLKLTCKEGTAWRETSFSLKTNQIQAINQFGMTSIKDEYAPTDSNLANFLFTVEKTKDGLVFQGLRGTSWKNLSFSCNNQKCSQLIDQNGMVVK